MALLFPGKSECAICGKVIEKSDEYVMFPAFLKSGHRLCAYADATSHKVCFDTSPDKEEVERLYSKFRQIWDERPKNLTSLEEINVWGRSAFEDFDK